MYAIVEKLGISIRFLLTNSLSLSLSVINTSNQKFSDNYD